MKGRTGKQITVYADELLTLAREHEDQAGELWDSGMQNAEDVVRHQKRAARLREAAEGVDPFGLGPQSTETDEKGGDDTTD